MDTTSADGAPCALCGDDAVMVERMKGNIQTALCAQCYDLTVICPECEQRVETQFTERINYELICEDCASHNSAVVGDVMAAINADEGRK